MDLVAVDEVLDDEEAHDEVRIHLTIHQKKAISQKKMPLCKFWVKTRVLIQHRYCRLEIAHYYSEYLHLLLREV